ALFLLIGLLPTGVQPLSLHDALPILYAAAGHTAGRRLVGVAAPVFTREAVDARAAEIAFEVQELPQPPVGQHRLHLEGNICGPRDRKSTRLNSSHVEISYVVFCLKKK